MITSSRTGPRHLLSVHHTTLIIYSSFWVTTTAAGRGRPGFQLGGGQHLSRRPREGSNRKTAAAPLSVLTEREQRVAKRADQEPETTARERQARREQRAEEREDLPTEGEKTRTRAKRTKRRDGVRRGERDEASAKERARGSERETANTKVRMRGAARERRYEEEHASTGETTRT